MTRLSPARSLCRGILLALLFATYGVAHAENQSVTLTDPRLIMEGAEKLEAVYDLPISYEDPPRVHDSELLGHRTVKSLGSLSFTYTVPPPEAMLEVRKSLAAAALADLLHNYAAMRGSEMFKVIKDEDGFHIVPIRYVNESGQIAELKTPLLDTPISLSMEDRTGKIAVMEICSKLFEATGQNLARDPIGAGFQNNKTASFGATNEPARSVLQRLIKALPVHSEVKVDPCPNRGTGPAVCYEDVPATLSWQTRCEPTGCVLHMYLVSAPGTVGGRNWHEKAAP